MEPLRIHTFGGLRIESGKETVSGFETRKAEALIVYLICTQRPQLREVLADLLWDERSHHQALSNLRVVLTSLRKNLDPYFTITRQTIAANPETKIWSDVAEFEALLDPVQKAGGVSTTQEAERAEQAVNLYRGEFLEGFYIRESRGFEEWLVRERERLHRLAVAALHDLVTYDLQSGAYQPGMERATRLLALEPLNEAGHRQMMQLLAYSGRRSEALAQYEACRGLLWDELGVEPAASTKALYEKIRAGELVRARPPLGAIRGYELEEQIGSGNYGAVYRAFQPAVGREVAVKVILPQYANDAEFIRRFEVEAQTVARLEHPHIVPLYDYWREPDGAYLVMRLLKGGNLEALLKSGPLEAGRLVGLVEQVAAGLALAHQKGVVHRDLKPANILLDEAGNIYLTDFGIAKLLGGNGWKTQTGGLFGTPAYLSPEQIRNEPVTPQTDIYSFGIILYQALTREAPFADGSLSELIDRHLYQPLPSVRVHRPDLPEEVDHVIQHATAKDPSGRFPDALALAAAFRQAVSGLPVSTLFTAVSTKELAVEITNPYKGLSAFQESDAADFFGREAPVERLVSRLGDEEEEEEVTRFLAVVGPSGSGKSSLVKAGLIPALRAGRVAGSEKWFIVEMLPGTHPLEELEAALLRIAVNPPASLLAQLQEDERGLVRAVKRSLPGGADAQLLLVIDQFEETFTLVEDREEARFFLDSLAAAVSDPRGQLRVAITLRADFYDRPLVIPEFSQLVQAGTEVVVPLTAEELVRAIQEPALRAGARFEEGLIPRIIVDVNEQPGALPLLQYSLTELFERREGNVLTRAAYDEIGGVLGALSRRAEAVYQELDEGGQAAARQVLLRLVTLGEGVEDTRRRVLRSELEGLEGIGERGKGAVESVLDAFGKARLLSFDRDLQTRGPTVEVAHEALLREWERLKGWLEDSRADVRLQRQLGQLAGDWLAAGEDSSFLLRGSRLALFESWVGETPVALTTMEREYLQAALAAREARRAEEAARQAREAALERRSRNVLRALVVVLILVAVGSLALASLRSREAQVNQSLALAAQSRLALQSGNLDLALALAMEAVRIPDPPGEVQVALSEAAYAPGTVKVYLGHSAPVRSVAVSPDGRYGLSGDDQGVILLWDLETGEALRRLEGHQAGVSGLAFTPDGRRALSASHDKAILYWDLEAGEVIHRLAGHRALVNTVAISPDGRTAASGSGRSFWTEPFSSEDNSVRLWDLQSGVEVQRFDFFTDGVTRVDFTADGRGLAVATISDGFLLLEVETGKAVVHRSPEINYLLQAQAVKTSPDGKFALTSNAFDPINNQYKILIWDLRTAEVIELGEHNGKITGLDISPDAKRALSGSIEIVEYDLESREEVNRFNIGANSVAYLPDGRSALAGSEDGSLRLLALASGAEIGRLPAGIDFIRGAAFDPAGQAVITDDSAFLSRWDLETGENIWSETFSGVFGEIALSLDGRRILASDGVATASLWQAASGELLGRLESDGSFVGHDSNGLVTSVALHPNGRFGLTGAEGQGTNLIYWDLESGSPVWLLDTNNLDVLGVAISPDGRTALSADSEGAVSWWDLEAGELLRRLEGHTNRAWSVAFVDEHTAISAAEDSSMILWDLENGTAIHNFLGHAAGIIRVALSPDKRLALSASRDRTAILWDVQTGEALRRYAGHSDHLMTVAWAPDGREAISGGADYQTIRWRIDAELDTLLEWIAGNRYLRPLTCNERATYKVEPLCPEGSLTEAGEPGSVPIRVAVSGAPILPPLPIPTELAIDSTRALAQVEEAGRAALGANRGSLAAGGGEVWEYVGGAGESLSIRVSADYPADMIGDPERQRQNGLLDPTLAVYSPDGSLLAEADDLENGLATDAYLDSITLPQSGIYRIEVHSYRDQTGGAYRLVLAEPRPLVFKAKVPAIAGLAIHPDGNTALVGMGYSIFWDSPPAEDQRIWVWDLRTGEVLRRLEGHTNTPADIAISPDGRRAISAGPEGLAILWDLESGAELLRIDNQGEVFVDVQFHPDGRSALTASTDTTLVLWDLASGEVIRRFEGHEDWVNDLALSLDGKTAYSTSWDNTVRIWNVATGELVATYRPFEDGYTYGLAVSPDGEYLLVGRDWYPYDPTLRYDGVIALLDADTGETLRHLEGHSAMVGAVAFSPDGRFALSGSRDQTVRLWEVDTGEQLAVFHGHAGEAWNVAFSPDGLTGYSTGSDGSLRVWDLREFVGARE